MNISFVGSGNVAGHLAKELIRNGHVIPQVYSRTLANAEKLASQTHSAAITDLGLLKETDIIIVCVKDDVLPEIVESLSSFKSIIIHTSGSTHLNVLKNENTGVLYPLQTFSSSREIKMNEVPFFLEAKNDSVADVLSDLCKEMNSKYQFINSEARMTLHISAVFACNFSNHLYTISKHLMDEHNLPFDTLKPLIAETAAKIKNMDPEQAQTGPAIRNDHSIMNKHLNLLSKHPELKDIYQSLSAHIMKVSDR